MNRFVKEMSSTRSDFLNMELSDVSTAMVRIGKTKWFPKYGCALLRLPDQFGCYAEETCPVILIGLDKWDRFVQRGDNNQRTNSTSSGHSRAFNRSIPTTSISNFFTTFERILTEAKKKTGSSRNAGHSDDQRGHHRTPGFIASVLEEAWQSVINKKTKKKATLGGWTDVGLHTGVEPRNTQWPLFRETLRALLHNNEKLVGILLINFDLFLIKQHLQKHPNIHKAKEIDFVSRMMTSLANRSLKLIRKYECDISLVKSLAIDLQTKLTQNRKKYATDLCLKYTIPKNVIQKCDHRLIRIESKNLQNRNIGASKLSMSAAKDLVRHTLRPIRLYANDLCDTPDLAAKLEQDGLTGDSKFLVLYEIERTLFEMFRLHIVGNSEVTLSNLKIGEVLYQKYAAVSRELTRGDIGMAAELKSKVFLLAMVLYCLAFQSTSSFHNSMKGFGVAFSPDVISPLLLRHRKYVKIALQIAAFLEKHTTRKPVFLLENETHTFALALAEANCNQTIQARFNEEKALETLRINSHWAAVKSKQREAKSIQHEINIHYTARDNFYSELNQKIQDLGLSKRERRRVREPGYIVRLRKKISILTSWIHREREELRLALIAPTPVIQRLPSNRNRALQILFFIDMPAHMCVLSRCTMTAKHAFVPAYRKDDPHGGNWGTSSHLMTSKIQSANDCRDFFNSQRRSKWGDGTKSKTVREQFSLLVSGNAPGRVMPFNVRDCTRKELGVWYPDISLAWKGKRREYWNVPQSVSYRYFTEYLPRDQRHFQWIVFANIERDASRGNTGIAWQHLQPGWLLKEQYLAWTSIRAYTTIEICKLIALLRCP